MNRWCGVVAGLAGLGMAAAVAADPEAELPDADLIEFLGSWEGEDDHWQAFVDSLPPAGEQGSGEQNPDDEDFTDRRDIDEPE